MEPRITLVTLGVADLARSVRFYRDGLGLPRRDGPDDIAFFETESTWLSLYPREKLAEDASVAAAGSGFRGVTLSHNVGSPEAVDQLLGEAVAAGATLRKPGQRVFWGGYSGYFEDPDGFLWEVAWNPHFHADAPDEGVLAVLDAFMDAFNARDGAALAATLHYPHVRLASGRVEVTETPEAFARFDFGHFAEAMGGWHHSEWLARRVVQADADKAHMAVRFARYRADGSRIALYDSLWVVSRRDGRWGIEARSSFAP